MIAEAAPRAPFFDGMSAGTRRAARDQAIVACAVGDELYALRSTDAFEIVRAERLRRSGAPDGAAGTVDVRGDPVPVYSLASVLGRPSHAMAAPPPSDRHIVITCGSAGLIGWLVDRTVRSSIAGGAGLMRLPAVLGPTVNRWFEGMLLVGGRSALLVAPIALDPRGPVAPTESETVSTPSQYGEPVVAGDGGASLVVLFSSSALPACDAPRYALGARRVAAVIHPLPITKVPGAARSVTGVICWRDSAVPVIDACRDGVGRTALPPHERYLVARYGPGASDLVAFAVTAAVKLHEATHADHSIADAIDSAPAFISGVFRVAGEPVALLDLPAMVASLSQATTRHRPDAVDRCPAV